MEDESKSRDFEQRYDRVLNLLHGYIGPLDFRDGVRPGGLRICAAQPPKRLTIDELLAIYRAGVDLNWLLTGAGRPLRESSYVVSKWHVGWLIMQASYYRHYHSTHDEEQKALYLKFLQGSLSRGRYAESVCAKWLGQIHSLAVLDEAKEAYADLSIDEITQDHVWEAILKFGLGGVSITKVSLDGTHSDGDTES